MLLRTKFQIIVLCYISAMVIVPSYPTPYIFFIDTVGTIISFTSIYFVFTFYTASVTAMNRTCIQGLSQLMLICFGLLLTRAFFVSLMVNVFHELTQTLITEYPNLSCHLFNDRSTGMPLFCSILMLVVSRLGLLLFPMRFQSLNHERIVQVCIALTVGLTLTDLFLSFTSSYFHYCINIDGFLRKNKFYMHPENLKESSFLAPVRILSFLTLFTEATNQFISTYRQFKVNKVNVVSNPITVPTPAPMRGTGNIFILQPSYNLANHPTTSTRRSSYPVQITVKTNFRRFSLKSSRTNATVKEYERPSQNVQINTGGSLKSGSTATRVRSQQGPRVVENQVQPQSKRAYSSFTLVMILIHSIFITWASFQNSEEHKYFIFHMIDIAHIVLVRFFKYCILMYLIYQSEQISAFTLAKSKNIIVRLLSFECLPIAVQNMADMFQ